MAHPAFSNLFVQTELLDKKHAIIVVRVVRSEKEHAPSMFHLMRIYKAAVQHVSYGNRS